MKNFNIFVKRAVLLLLFLWLFLFLSLSWMFGIELGLALLGFPLEENTVSIKTPRCKALSARGPGRLNIDTSTKGYGFTQSCESYLSFYISKNTALRSLDGKIEVLDSGENILFEYAVHVDLQKGNTGMYHGDYPVEPVDGYSCRDLILKLSSLICRDKKGERIDCPKIRLKSSTVLQDLLIDNKNLNVCFDD